MGFCGPFFQQMHSKQMLMKAFVSIIRPRFESRSKYAIILHIPEYVDTFFIPRYNWYVL